MTESGHGTQAFNRRGCVALTVIAGLFLLIAIAISLGWLGQVDTNKNAGVPVTEGNQI